MIQSDYTNAAWPVPQTAATVMQSVVDFSDGGLITTTESVAFRHSCLALPNRRREHRPNTIIMQKRSKCDVASQRKLPVPLSVRSHFDKAA